MPPRSIIAIASAVVLAVCLLVAGGASGEQAASEVRSFQAGTLDVAYQHSCAVIADGTVRCWGDGANGKLGYGNLNAIGDNEAPASAGPVDLGVGRTARAISAGDHHTCALLAGGNVRCWGYGIAGRLGYANTLTIGDNETPASVGPVDLGAGRTAQAISAGGDHTCAILDNGGVRCWGAGVNGRLGYGNTNDIGDNETPGSVGPVDLGAGRTARAISAGAEHTCALLDDGNVRCWGTGSYGELGYGNTNSIGDNETPGSVTPVNLGAGRTAQAISAGDDHTCALLDDGSVRCWGYGASGRLGYGNTNDIGENETPGSVGPVDLGVGRTARAISAGGEHTCALLDDGSVRCWGAGFYGRLGYGNTNDIGDNETPGSVVPVSLGGTLIASVGDLSLSMTSDVPARQAGQDVRFALTLANSGPDTAGGVAVGDSLPPGLAFVGASASHGGYSAQTGMWQVGALGPGGTATLELTARVVAVGTLTNVGEVAASNVFDQDSTAANGVVGEDDRAAAQITATPDVTPPSLTAYSLSRSTFAAAATGRSVASAAKIGTRVRYTLSEPGAVRFTVERGAPGRLVQGSCRTPTRQNLRAKRCTRYGTMKGSFTHAGSAGANRFKFTGRLRGRKLRPGRYRLVAVPRDAAGNRSKPKRVKFRIVRR